MLMTPLLGLVLICCLPDMAQASETVSILGSVICLADVRNYEFGWGDTSFSAEQPVLENSTESPSVTESDQPSSFEPDQPAVSVPSDPSNGVDDMN